MGRALGRTAKSVGCSERTLRRYAKEGLLRSRNLGYGRLEIPASEERYLRRQWPLLSALKRALRTERDVRLAVLFGSTATGEDHRDSDVDLLVAHRHPSLRAHMGLQLRLRRALGRTVHVVGLAQAETTPALLADALQEGRLVIDRNGRWDELKEREAEVLAAAEREDKALARRAAESLLAARERS